MAHREPSHSQLGGPSCALRQIGSPVDALGLRVAALAAGRHGVVTTGELLAFGLDHPRIRRWVRAGRLHRIHRGVYAVGHRTLTREGRWLAAVRACGPDALLSHLSAAVLWHLVRTDPALVHVIVPRSRAGESGIAMHRSRNLDRCERAEHMGIAVTSPTQTFFDLAGMLGRERLRAVLAEGERSGVLDPAALSAALGPHRGRRGMRNARAVLAAFRPAPARFRSKLERTFWEACLEADPARLPPPEMNARVGGLEVDALWRDRKLVVELDGRRYHDGRLDVEADRRRDLLLRASGYDVLRVSDEQIAEDLDRVLATIATVYAGRGDG